MRSKTYGDNKETKGNSFIKIISYYFKMITYDRHHTVHSYQKTYVNINFL
jgi:hypothetical protein